MGLHDVPQEAGHAGGPADRGDGHQGHWPPQGRRQQHTAGAHSKGLCLYRYNRVNRYRGLTYTVQKPPDLYSITGTLSK